MSEYIVDVGDEDEKHVQRFKTQATSLFGHPINEQVVRCRDCIHCEEAINGKALCEYFSTEGSLGTLYPTVEWDGFCAWGERIDA